MRSLFRLLDRKPGEADGRPEATLYVASKAEAAETAGLVVFDLSVAADSPATATLVVSSPGIAEPFRMPLMLAGEPKSLWLAVHGHLLPNGPVEVVFTLEDADGRRLAGQRVTVQVRNTGPLAEATRASLIRSGAPFAVTSCDSGDYDYADPALVAWHDRSDEAAEAHVQALAASGAATADEAGALRHFVRHGYIVMPDLLTADELATLNAALDQAVADKVEGYEWGESRRLHELHRRYPALHGLWTHPRVLRMLSLIFDAPARPYQSLTYVFGSEQQYHQDTVALTPFPAGRMCGVWTALEDVQADSGELMIYPGSHRQPRIYLKDAGVPKVVAEDWSAFTVAVPPIWGQMIEGMGRDLYRPKAGTVLIWHENLMHAGRVRRARDLSRRSFVGHYFAEGSIVYHDATGMPGVFDT